MTSKEAFETLKRYEAELSITKQTEVAYDVVISARYEISKLVERDTPMKVKKETYTNGFFKLWACSVCGSTFQKWFVYCPDCGQRIDWSE